MRSFSAVMAAILRVWSSSSSAMLLTSPDNWPISLRERIPDRSCTTFSLSLVSRYRRILRCTFFSGLRIKIPISARQMAERHSISREDKQVCRRAWDRTWLRRSVRL